MKAFVIEGKGKSYFTEVPEPALQNEHWVKVKVESCGICGTDLHIYEGEHKMSIGQRRIPGHEFAGTVVETGPLVEGLQIGDRVVHEPIRYCGECYACRQGQGNVCERLQVTGCNMSGGMEEYFAAGQRQWHKLPDWMSWEEAALVEPYTIGAQVCARAEIRKGDVVLIHGGGPIGLICGDTAAQLGANVILSEVLEGRLALAKELGIPHVIDAGSEDVKETVRRLTGGEGPNVVLDCAGLPRMLEEAMELLSPAGRLVPVAGGTFMFDGAQAMMKQLRVVGSRLQMGQFEPVLSGFQRYQQHARRMITHVFPFAKLDEAFAFAAGRDPRAGKIVIRFS